MPGNLFGQDHLHGLMPSSFGMLMSWSRQSGLNSSCLLECVFAVSGGREHLMSEPGVSNRLIRFPH